MDKKVVLIVDDEPEIRKLVAAMVSQLGYAALTADSGEHALTVHRNQGPFALLITDVVAPGMSGPMLAEKLIQMQPNLKVLFISGYDNTHLVRKFVVEPGHALLPKPFTVGDLKSKLDAMLAGISATA